MERVQLKESGNRVAVHVLLPNSAVRSVQHQRIDWDLDTSGTVEKLLEIALELPGPNTPPTGNNDTFRDHPDSKLIKLHLPESLIKRWTMKVWIWKLVEGMCWQYSSPKR